MDVFRYGFLSEITCKGLSSSKTAILSWSLCFFFGLRQAKTLQMGAGPTFHVQPCFFGLRQAKTLQMVGRGMGTP